MHMCGLFGLAFGLFSIFWEISLIYAGACQCRALKSSKSQNQNLKVDPEVIGYSVYQPFATACFDTS